MGAPSSRAVFALMRICTPVPCASMNYKDNMNERNSYMSTNTLTPDLVVVAGRDISVGSRPMANSVSALLVAFMLANSYEPSSLKSSKPPASMIFALPERSVSHAISIDCKAVALYLWIRDWGVL